MKDRELKGVYVHIQEGDDGFMHAVVEIDGDLSEIANVRKDLFEGPGDPKLHEWIDLISGQFGWKVQELIGHDVHMKRRKAKGTG